MVVKTLNDIIEVLTNLVWDIEHLNLEEDIDSDHPRCDGECECWEDGYATAQDEVDDWYTPPEKE